MITFKEIPATKQSIAQRKLVFGVGINDAPYMIRYTESGKSKMCKYYLRWLNMLTRCYDKKYQEKKPTYIGCYVCNEWLYFSNFKAWMEVQNHQGRHLDKDLIEAGNKEYSPEKCIFVPQKINSLMNSQESRRGDFPQGVYLEKSTGKFKAECSNNGKTVFLGRFYSSKDAEKAYKIYKKKVVQDSAKEFELSEPILFSVLMEVANGI